jgi:ribose/xylose/arabinose/galactoside ABC-type transport system permease subunit
LTPGTQLSPEATVEAPATSASDPGRNKKKQSRLALLVMTPEFTLAIAVALVAIFLTVESSAFATWGNLKLIFTGASPEFFVCVGVTLLMVGGGIDLSVGSVAALCAVVTGKFLQSGIPIPFAILIGLAMCVVIGLTNGVLITRFGIPSLIVTLGGLYALSGVALQITSAQPVAPLPDGFNAIAQNDVGPIPLLLVYAIVAGLIGYFVLNRTKFGYQVRAVGGNADSARAAGINVNRIRYALYSISAVGAGLTGIMFASQIGDADPNGQSTLMLTAISAVIIGGTSLFGGIGTVLGTALGVVLVTLLSNGLVLLSISPFYQQIVVGAVVVGAVGLDGFRRNQLWSRNARLAQED